MRAFVVLTVLLGAAVAMAAQDRCAPPSTVNAIAQVRTLNQQYIDAVRTSDTAWFARHMAADVLVVLGSGASYRKPEFLALVGAEAGRVGALSVRNVTVRVFGAVAQVDAEAPWQHPDGRSGVSRYIDTYVWSECRWQVISAQVTALRQP